MDGREVDVRSCCPWFAARLGCSLGLKQVQVEMGGPGWLWRSRAVTEVWLLADCTAQVYLMGTMQLMC